MNYITTYSIGDFRITIPVILTLMLCISVILLAAWVMRQRIFPGRSTFVLIHLTSLWWLITAALEISAISPAGKIFWATMAWPGIVAMPTFWAVFLWQYVNSVHSPISLRNVVMLTIMPVAFWMMALTNNTHQLFYGAGTGPISQDIAAPINYEHGILFDLAAVYVYVFMVFCLGIVIKAAFQTKGLYRRHYMTFVAITTVPWLANIAYVFFDFTVYGFDPTPFSFAFTMGAFAWLILSVRLFDLLPVAHHLLLEALLDPVLVIDPDNRVIEANPAALKLAGLDSVMQGQYLESLPVIGTTLQNLVQKSPEYDEELLLTIGELKNYFEFRTRIISRDSKNGSIYLGQMLYLRDVTQRYVSELKLTEALAVSEERNKTISELHEKLREQALRDPLTGLYNRRYLDTFFTTEQNRAKRSGLPIAIALIDLDHFKQLNDQYGHLVGDDVLRAVSAHLQTNIRISDVAFRIGGEEFLLVLPGVESAEAFSRISDLIAALSAQPVSTRNGDISITCSVGLAYWPQHGQTLDELFAKADSSLYAAKNSGRNLVVD